MVFKFEFSTYSHSHIVKKWINISFEGSLSLSNTHTHAHKAVLENMKFIPIYWNFMIFNLGVDFT